MKVQLPIPNLPSWYVVALILAYYGWLDEVLTILHKLSNKTRAYALSHHKYLLSEFVTHSRWHSHTLPNILEPEQV